MNEMGRDSEAQPKKRIFEEEINILMETGKAGVVDEILKLSEELDSLINKRIKNYKKTFMSISKYKP